MAGFMGRLRLKCGPENIVTSRVNSRAGMPLLSDHRVDLAVGMITRLESKGSRVEGESELVETERNAPYLEELREGLRRGISPGFLIHDAHAQDDPDFPGEVMLEIRKWEPYEISATAVPRNEEAGLLGIANRSDRASLSPADIEDIQEKVNIEVSNAVEELRVQNEAFDKRIEEGKSMNKYDIKVAHVNGRKDKPQDEAESPEPKGPLAMTLRAMLFGNIADMPKGVEHEGPLGQKCWARAAFDTTNAYGVVSTMGGAMVADDYFETSPQRILMLPRRIENIMGDQQVPTLLSEPNSAMVTQGTPRFAVVDATFESSPPTLTPHRLQTVVDYSMEQTLVAPGFEDWVLDVGDGR